MQINQQRWSVLDRAAERLKKNEKELLLKTADETVVMPVREIRYLDVQQNYVTVHGKIDVTVNLNIILMLVVIVTTVISFFVSRKTDSWRYRRREEESEYDKKIGYIRSKSESVELAKDIRIFGLAPWLQSIHNSILKLYESFVKKSEKQKLVGNIVDVLLGVLRNGIA